jgi:hypothetical protein
MHEKEKKQDKRTVVPEPEYVQPEKIEKKSGKRKVTSNLVWLVGVVMVFAIIWLVIWPGSASNTSQADTESEITKETNERDIKAAGYADLFDGWEVIKQELPFVTSIYRYNGYEKDK